MPRGSRKGSGVASLLRDADRLPYRVLLSALDWDFWSFAFFRMVTGLGIGGESQRSILIRAESPRWLVIQCRSEEAEETVKRIEADVGKSTGHNLPPAHGSLEVHPRKVFGLGLILTAMLGRYRERSILALVSW